MAIASLAAAESTSETVAATCDVSLARVYVLRATYLLLVVGLGTSIAPQLIDHAPSARGVISSLLTAVGLLALIGLKHPLQMLPLLMFELAWKAIWLFAFGIPQWSGGSMPATCAEDFRNIVFGVILMPIVIPWRYVYRRYVRQPAERWR